MGNIVEVILTQRFDPKYWKVIYIVNTNINVATEKQTADATQWWQGTMEQYLFPRESFFYTIIGANQKHGVKPHELYLGVKSRCEDIGIDHSELNGLLEDLHILSTVLNRN